MLDKSVNNALGEGMFLEKCSPLKFNFLDFPRLSEVIQIPMIF